MRHVAWILVLLQLTCLASEETLIIGKRSETSNLTVLERIDGDIQAKLTEATVPASPQCSDAEFIRRATLDINGTLPTVERVKAFLADKNQHKREALVDELLSDSDYGDYFGAIWFDLLVNLNDDNRNLISHTFEPWLSEQFNANTSWDKIVTAILTAEGKRDENPATVFWFANSDMNAKPAHVKTADAVGKITQRFLGTQFQCAECHDHPFTPLKQADFWGTAAFFGSLSLKDAQKKMVKADGNPGLSEKSEKGKKGVIEIPDSKNDTAKTQFPDGTPFDASTASGSLRTVFAKWCTSPENEQFSRAMANRMWAHFCGRGFVMPVDDFRKNNKPTHPEALDALTQDFTASGFDLKHLVRRICATQAYQRSSETQPQNAADTGLFSHAPLKMMTASVLESSLEQSLGNEFAAANGRGKGARPNAPAKKKNAGAKKAALGSPFEQAFATSEEPDDPEYSHGVPQVLQLMNGGHLAGSALLKSVGQASTTKEAIEHLYLSTLSRPPSEKEASRMQTFVEGATTKSAGYQGVLWALLNSSEYVLNH